MKDAKINVVIPMAGLGSRFAVEGFEKPKPFIDVMGKPMIARVLNNLAIPNAIYYLIAREEHLIKEAELVKNIEEQFPVKFIGISNLTEGTVCTVLFAREYINNDIPLLIANSDQIIDLDINEFIYDSIQRKLDGSILTFIDEEKNPKWSFAEVDSNGVVKRVKEKEAISNIATVGIYLFSQGKDFVNSSIDMIINNERINNEFYTCPVYNYLIKSNKKIGHFIIESDKMYGLGTPEDLQNYLAIKYE
jgi:NDP-sugar pyrophosphorylase family protein